METKYFLEIRVIFWVVITFTLITFVLWIALPGGHRAIPVLERTWPPLITGFVGFILGKLR